jgi:23S rRNA pseudouridine1911/1915/1917 synthase
MDLTYTSLRSARLSDILRQDMHLSAGHVIRLKLQQKLFVNGTPRHTDYAVSPWDEISVPLDDPAPQYPAEPGELEIIYEDDHLLAVDKPAGMLIHPSRSQLTGTLANRVLYHYQSTNQSCAFHPVTRLDRDTFGIVLLAKSAHVHALLQQNPLQKTYHALVLGTPAAPCGEIDAPIARRPLPSLLRFVSQEGKPSLTRYKTLSSHDGYAKLSLEPVTGRTHQLRVHCAYMGCPILGDPQYGNDASLALSALLGYHTQKLCAYSLTFPHPITGTPLHLRTRL